MTYLYPLYDALVGVNVPSDRARAVIDAMERDVLTQLATKSDLASLGRELRSELSLVRQESDSAMRILRKDMDASFALLRKDLDAQRKDLIIWLGSLQLIGMGTLFAALRLL